MKTIDFLELVGNVIFVDGSSDVIYVSLKDLSCVLDHRLILGQPNVGQWSCGLRTHGQTICLTIVALRLEAKFVSVMKVFLSTGGHTMSGSPE